LLEYSVKNNRKEGCPTFKKEKERKQGKALLAIIYKDGLHP